MQASAVSCLSCFKGVPGRDLACVLLTFRKSFSLSVSNSSICCFCVSDEGCHVDVTFLTKGNKEVNSCFFNSRTICRRWQRWFHILPPIHWIFTVANVCVRLCELCIFCCFLNILLARFDTSVLRSIQTPVPKHSQTATCSNRYLFWNWHILQAKRNS